MSETNTSREHESVIDRRLPEVVSLAVTAIGLTLAFLVRPLMGDAFAAFLLVPPMIVVAYAIWARYQVSIK